MWYLFIKIGLSLNFSAFYALYFIYPSKSTSNSIVNNVYTISKQTQIPPPVYYLQFCLLTTYLTHPFLWARKHRVRERGRETQRNAYSGKKGNHHFFPFLVWVSFFFFLLPSLFCRALSPAQLCFLRVTNCWSCCFSAFSFLFCCAFFSRFALCFLY